MTTVERDIMLRDGRLVHVRPVQPGDGPALAEAFSRLSEDSARARFGAPPRALTAAALRRLVDAVDGVNHVAFAAFASAGSGPGDGRSTDSTTGRDQGKAGAARIVGIGRILRYPHDRDSLDVAITVADDYQGAGLGRMLADLLATYRPRPARRILTQIAARNMRALAMLGSFGTTHRRSGDGDVVMEFDE